MACAFRSPSFRTRTPITNLHSSNAEEIEAGEYDRIQWELFQKHHARGSWRGTWDSYDYIGDVIDSTVASVVLEESQQQPGVVTQTHEIVTGETKSDCPTCFDSTNIHTLPVAQYTSGALRRQRLGSVGLINGPTVLRSGAMSTELALVHGDGRLRVIFYHAPVWEKGVEPNTCPPQGLKVYRATVCREALRPLPPTRSNEQDQPPTEGNPTFNRPVPPFAWHANWSGTSWTWGETRGDEGWKLDEMDELDSWHGRPTGDTANTWNLRLPGGVLIQCPRIIRASEGSDEDGGLNGMAELMRVAWLPTNDRLLRLEASVLAMDRPILDPNDGAIVGFQPPRLGSLRTDVVRKVGELEGVSLLERERKRKDGEANEEELVKPGREEMEDDTVWE